MANVEKDFAKGKPVYLGLDVHRREWTVTVLCQGEENGKPATSEKVDAVKLSPFEAAFFAPLRVVLPVSENTWSLDARGLEFNRHNILHSTDLKYGTGLNSLKSISLVYYLARLKAQLTTHSAANA
jgi:hypothetical protein